MISTNGLDSTSSPLAFFGTELRRVRTFVGMSQIDLSKKLHVVSSLISKIETADRVPSEDLAGQLDAIFETDGHFGRLWPLAVRHAFPAWFRPYVHLEAQATDLRTYACHAVPDLLQTPDYAHAVLATGRWHNIEELLAAHLRRQRILTRDEPARLWAIMDERVLHRTYGDEAIMRDQLAHLLKAAESPHIVIQVLGHDAAPYPATGPFTTLSFGDGTPDVLYEDGIAHGHMTADPTIVRDAHRIYDLLRAAALPPGPSTDLIAATLKDLCHDH